MKRISMIAAATTVAAILACGGGDDDNNNNNNGGDDGTVTNSDGGSTANNGGGGSMNASDLPSVSLTSPWSGMNLPTAGGNVVVSDANVLLIAYDGGSISSYASSYGAAVKADGWSQSEDYSTPEFTAILFTKGDGELGMAVGVEEGINFVYFENLKEVSESDSNFRSAKTGRLRVGDKMRRRRGGGGGGGSKAGKGGKRKR